MTDQRPSRLTGDAPGTPLPEMAAKALIGPFLKAGLVVKVLADIRDPDRLTTQANAISAMIDGADQVIANNLKGAERMLWAQAVTLDNLFNELALRSVENLGYPDAMRHYLNMGLRAQHQARATLETLATIKNPPVMFAKQVNASGGGPMQVNNGTDPPKRRAGGNRKPKRRTEKLEAKLEPWMDTGTSSEAVAGHSTMEAVAENARPQDV